MSIGNSVPRCVARLLLAAASAGVVGENAVAQQPNAAAPAVVAARRLERGAVLAEDDIARVPATTSTPDAIFAAPGWVTRRVVQPGELLRPPAVVPAPDVRAASHVAVITQSGAVQVRVSGVALAAGVIGDTILVTLGTGARIRARIDNPGHVVALGSGRTSR